MKQRDNQRQRLYDSQYAWTGSSKMAQRLLRNGKHVKSTGNVSIEACQKYVDELCQRAWFKRRFGDVEIEVKLKTSGSATGYPYASGIWPDKYGVRRPWYRGWICLPPFARTEAVILHEVGHVLTPKDCAWHGPEFAGIFLELVRYTVGAEAAKTQREAFRKKRVRVKSLRANQTRRAFAA